MTPNIIWIAAEGGLDTARFIADLYRFNTGCFYNATDLTALTAQALLRQYTFGTVKRFRLTAKSLIEFLNNSDSLYTFVRCVKKGTGYKLTIKKEVLNEVV